MKNLEYIRKLQGMSRKQFSDSLGISSSHYSRLTDELNSRGASLSVLTRACQALKCSPCLILCESHNSLKGKISICKYCILSTDRLTLKMFLDAGITWDDYQKMIHHGALSTNLDEKIDKILKRINEK